MNARRASAGLSAAVLTALVALAPNDAGAQPCQHGASIFKTCQSVKRTCANNLDCDDGIQCTDDACDLSIGNTTDCAISLAHADTCGDVTKITEAFDIDDFGGDNVRTPPVGNLPISGVFGNAVCCAGPSLPCFVAPAGLAFVVPAATTGCGNLALPASGTAGSVQFRSNTYVVQPDDPDPLPNQGNVKVQDLCNAGAVGCSTGINTVQFTASTDLVTGCINTPSPDSTPCADVDGNLCTTAGCDGFGSCDQAHLDTPCPPDANPCTQDPACNPQTGLCEKPPVPDSTPCPDTDGNQCTSAGCEAGQCVQTHNQVVCPPDTNPCTSDPACNPQNGLCEKPPVPDSTPCPDTDGNLCTAAGCELGQCVQTHMVTTCPPDQNQCTLDPACNPQSGLCEHPPVPDSTPCGDTDQNACTGAGCEMGQCVQDHLNLCPPPINHFTCYEIKPFTFTAVPGVSLVDQFGSTTVTVNRPTKLCAPADKNDEDPAAPSDPDHLTGYRIRNPAIRSVDQTIVNQFGTLHLDVTKTDLLFVPTAKSVAAPAPPEPADPAIDHFQCYKVKRTRGTAKFVKIVGVKVDDQFGSGTIDLLRPKHLCAPANKRNEEPGAELHPDHLLCYKVKAPAPFAQKQVWLGNQFGPHNQLTLIRRQEFCVPSLKNPGTSTTTTPTTTTSSTTVGSPSGAFVGEGS